MVLVASIVFWGQGCSKEGNALKKFEKSVSCLQREIETSDNYVSLDGFEYNMKNNNSIKTPYVGTIEFIYTAKVSPEKAKELVKVEVLAGEILAKKRKEFGDSDWQSVLVSDDEAAKLQKSYQQSGLIRYKYLINLIFENGNWIIDQAKYVSRNWHQGEDVNSATELDKIFGAEIEYKCDNKELETINNWLNLN